MTRDSWLQTEPDEGLPHEAPDDRELDEAAYVRQRLVELSRKTPNKATRSERAALLAKLGELA